jgi:DNA-binding IclR family transcriptional regulator
MMDESSSIADKNGVQVIARAAAILLALEANPEGLSLGELAKQLGMARSPVQRLVGALAEEQLLMSAGPRSGVTLGPALIRIAAAANVDTDRIARPILQALSRRLTETVDLSTLRGRSAVFVDQVVGSSRLTALSAVGEAFPLHNTANGKALLAITNPERARTLMKESVARYEPGPRKDLTKLAAEIDEVREAQLAFDLEEHSEGICAVGAAFLDSMGREFAISVPVPTARFAAKRAAIEEQLLLSRDEIVKAIPGARATRAH